MNDGDERRDSLGRGGGGVSMAKIFFTQSHLGANEAVSGFSEDVATGRIYRGNPGINPTLLVHRFVWLCL